MPETTPASTATAPVATPTPAAAKPAFAPQVSDITPKQKTVHRVTVPQAELPTFAALIDPQAPAGAAIAQINAFMQEGNLVLTVTYAS